MREENLEKSNFSIVSAANLIVAVLAAFYFSSCNKCVYIRSSKMVLFSLYGAY